MSTSIGQLIREKRKEKNLSQKRLGALCGISDSEVMKIENGVRKTPNWESLCKIAKALDIHPFEYLLAAGYISEKDFQVKLLNLEKLSEEDIKYVQLFIDFIVERKCCINEGGKNHAV